ncbi:MAG: AarF/ABC1/UbiB kinase family protein [Dehalococcoidia bacterium]|nr:AarF/ABC1/UbiB kinase family protein [Dehalococcoidia bacterium]
MGTTPASVRIRATRLRRSSGPLRLALRAARRWAATYLVFGQRRKRKREEFVLRTADDVTRTMGEMKGAVMKVGQILSMMTGVLPEEMTRELASLHAKAPPMAYELVEEVFQQEFGQSPQAVFRRFEREPFAAASIGQVHRAWLHDGTAVAVKVQYPGVREAIEHDLANVGMLVTFAGMVSRGLEAGPIVRDLTEGIQAELDYRQEAANQQRFYEAFEGHAFIRVPKVFREYTRSRVLVQEFMEGGRPFAEAYELPQAERDRIGEIIYRFAFGSIYRHRLFNGDPHPGNYLLMPDGSVAFVDYGCVAEFSPEVITRFGAVITAFVAGDREAWRHATEDVGILRKDAPFTTDELWDHMHWYWAPIMAEEITFTPELAAEMIRHNTQTTGHGGAINRHCNVPEGMVFLTRINFGLAGVMANLHARGPWQRIILEYVEGTPPSTPLGELSAATSRSNPV